MTDVTYITLQKWSSGRWQCNIEEVVVKSKFQVFLVSNDRAFRIHVKYVVLTKSKPPTFEAVTNVAIPSLNLNSQTGPWPSI